MRGSSVVPVQGLYIAGICLDIALFCVFSSLGSLRFRKASAYMHCAQCLSFLTSNALTILPLQPLARLFLLMLGTPTSSCSQTSPGASLQCAADS